MFEFLILKIFCFVLRSQLWCMKVFATKPDGMSSIPAPQSGRRKPTLASCPLTYTPTRMCHSMHKPPHTVTFKNTKAWFYHCYFSLFPHWRQNPDIHCTCLLVLPTLPLRNKIPELLPKKKNYSSWWAAPGPGDTMPYSDLCWGQAHMWHTCIHAYKTLTC